MQQLADAIWLEATYQWHAVGVFKPLSREEYVRLGGVAASLVRR